MATDVLPPGRVMLAQAPFAQQLAAVGTDLPVGSDAWWQRVAALGTPLRAQLPGAGEVLVLVHRSTAPVVYADLAGYTDRTDLRHGVMDRVPGTDVWTACFRLEPGWIGSYTFMPLPEVPRAPGPRNTPETRAWWVELISRACLDPLNPRPPLPSLRTHPHPELRSVAADRPADVEAATSTTAGQPGTVQQVTWTRPGAGLEHPVWLYASPTTAGAGELAVVVVFDGQVWAELGLPALLDDLVTRGVLPPLVAVLVSSVDLPRRAADLTCNPDFIDEVSDHLLGGVVKDWARGRSLVVTTDPARTVAVGQSYGGLAAFFAGMHRPDRFARVLSQSGSFWWPSPGNAAARPISQWLRHAEPRPTRTVLQHGTHEEQVADGNREVAALLAERQEWHQVLAQPGGHDWAWWRAKLGAGLAALLAP